MERRIKAAKFPTVKSLDSFEFKAIPSVNKARVLELARCEWIERRENVIALGPSGTGKSHVAQGLGLAACQQGMSVRFVTAAALVHEVMETRDERRLMRLHKQLANHKLLIIDLCGVPSYVEFVPPIDDQQATVTSLPGEHAHKTRVSSLPQAAGRLWKVQRLHRLLVVS